MSTSPRNPQRPRRAPRAALGALCLGLAAPVAAAEPIGQVAAVEGQVDLRSFAAAASAWQPAALDQALELGDWIRTQRNARARILLANDSVLSVDEETELGLDQAVVGAAGGRPHPVIQQVSGQVLTAVGEAFGGQTRLEVHTPTAVLGVKGTVFEVRVRRETLACVYQGNVSVRNANPAVKGEELIPEGWCREVHRDRPPGPPQAPPRDFRSAGPGPEAGPLAPQIDALLFPPGDAAAGGPGGGRGSGQRDLFDWIADVPPVAAAADEGVEPDGGPGVEPAYEDAPDAALATGGLLPAISVGGGEAPGPPPGE